MVFAAGFIVSATSVSSLFPKWLSNSCIETITDISSNGTFTCFKANKLPTILLAPTTQSFIDGVDSWVAFACAQSACSDAVVESLFTQVTTKCATDLNHIGVAGLVIEDIGLYRRNWYELGRGCTSNTSCISTTLHAVADHANVTLGISSLWSAVLTLVESGKEVLKNVACTSCARGAYDLTRPFLSFFELVAADISLGSLCGANFFNGTCPAETIQPTNTISLVPSATPSPSVTTTVSATPSVVTTASATTSGITSTTTSTTSSTISSATTSATTSASATTNATTTASARISATTSAGTSANATRSPCANATPNASVTSPTTTSVSTTTSATTTTSASAITNAVTNAIAKTSANSAISLKTGLFGSTAAIILAIALTS
ncbi:hypothetical protein BDV93DRAFT_562367 [Ceratobasidium sp. AG-I]|nr:hypothetical protein BDV93DRAFT_562367 [Ceratobasidium sp. AG-I]